MTQPHAHATHPAPVARLRRADGLLGAGPGMIETGKPCLLITQQLQAAEKAVLKAKARYL
jgi:DNA-binding FrmR family transcriptional regulator